MQVAFKVATSTEGKLTANFEDLKHGVSVPVASLQATDRTIRMTISVAQFEGELSADGKSIEGTFTQNGVPYALTLHRGEMAEPSRTQVPRPPFPYRSEDVSIASQGGNVTLAGTLTLPPGAGPFPSIVLLSGSGAQDRDETVLGHKPFLVIADYLTRLGIAVLRIDDRGVGKSTGTLATATDEDLAGDALACVEYLKSRKQIDVSQIGLLGHIEGATVASQAAIRSADVAFVIMLVGPGVRGDLLLREQGIQSARANQAPLAVVERQVGLQTAEFRIVRAKKIRPPPRRSCGNFSETVLGQRSRFGG